MESISEIIRFLADDALTIEAIAARLGPVARDPGGLMPLELQPRMPGVRAIKVARYPDSAVPYLVEIEPEEPARPALGSLRSELGEFHRLRTDIGRPVELAFRPRSEGTGWAVVVIARLATSDEPLDTAPVMRITFRRDPLRPGRNKG